MKRTLRLQAVFLATLTISTSFWLSRSVYAQENPSSDSAPQAEESQPWLEPIPLPTDPELEAQIHEVQDALSAIHTQMVRRKELLQTTQDATKKSTLYDELETLRKEREDLEALLHDLVDEARLSERTAIDEALAKVRWLERRQEALEKKEELIRDRQE